MNRFNAKPTTSRPLPTNVPAGNRRGRRGVTPAVAAALTTLALASVACSNSQTPAEAATADDIDITGIARTTCQTAEALADPALPSFLRTVDAGLGSTSPAGLDQVLHFRCPTTAARIAEARSVTPTPPPPPTATPTPPATATPRGRVTGTIDLIRPAGQLNPIADKGRPCAGTGGYSDIASGMEVLLVSDGKTIGLGRLGPGQWADIGTTATCRFTFSITVPEGHDFYTLRLGRRGEHTYTYREITSPGALAYEIGR